MFREREREEPGALETKVITPGKIVPSNCCLPNWNICVKKDFDTDVLTFGQTVNKHGIFR